MSVGYQSANFVLDTWITLGLKVCKDRMFGDHNLSAGCCLLRPKRNFFHRSKRGA